MIQSLCSLSGLDTDVYNSHTKFLHILVKLAQMLYHV